MIIVIAGISLSNKIFLIIIFEWITPIKWFMNSKYILKVGQDIVQYNLPNQLSIFRMFDPWLRSIVTSGSG